MTVLLIETYINHDVFIEIYYSFIYVLILKTYIFSVVKNSIRCIKYIF